MRQNTSSALVALDRHGSGGEEANLRKRQHRARPGLSLQSLIHLETLPPPNANQIRWLCVSGGPNTSVRLHTTSPSASTAAAAHGFTSRDATTAAIVAPAYAARTLCGPAARTATARCPRYLHQTLHRPPRQDWMTRAAGTGSRWCRGVSSTCRCARTCTPPPSCPPVLTCRAIECQSPECRLPGAHPGCVPRTVTPQVLANNATPDMYSFFPWRNRAMVRPPRCASQRSFEPRHRGGTSLKPRTIRATNGVESVFRQWRV